MDKYIDSMHTDEAVRVAFYRTIQVCWKIHGISKVRKVQERDLDPHLVLSGHATPSTTSAFSVDRREHPQNLSSINFKDARTKFSLVRKSS